MDFKQKSISLHRRHQGKIELKAKVPLKSKIDIALAYTPGVGAVAEAIGRNKKLSLVLTNRANQVAIVSDGTAVLGLGRLGPEAALPVMEGKAALFKEFADIDAFPLCVNTTEPDKIVDFCKLIEPSFGGINLEDIAAPGCFAVLARLEKELRIPVFHDDQDGTAIIVLAALVNACKLTGRSVKKAKIAISGAGAAGIAVARLLLVYGAKDLILSDSQGAIYAGRKGLNSVKRQIAQKTNSKKISGGLAEVLKDRDVFIGVSKGNLVTPAMVKSMKPRAVVFALANPVPEIRPDWAKKAGAAIVGTGRSDFPNQINNALVFPGIFRGLLDGKNKKITDQIKIKVAAAIAQSVKPRPDKILPLLLEKKTTKAISRVIRNNPK